MAKRAIMHAVFLNIHALFPFISWDNQQCTAYVWVSNFVNLNDRDFTLSWLVLVIKISTRLAKSASSTPLLYYKSLSVHTNSVLFSETAFMLYGMRPSFNHLMLFMLPASVCTVLKLNFHFSYAVSGYSIVCMSLSSLNQISVLWWK